MPSSLSPAEKRRQRTDARRRQTAAAVTTPEVSNQPQLSFVAQSLSKAFPRELVETGAIRLDQRAQPRVGLYEPALLAPNPQRGRVANRDLDSLAASLDAHGQQEPLLARLLTETDHKRWPDAFTDKQLLLILKGHRLFAAQRKSKLTMLKVELLLPDEGEDDLTYSRRALRRAAIKLMHSQAYDIFDKVNQYMIWREEFALAQPKDTEVATYFDISRTEAQRLKAVAQLDPAVSQEIINAERRPADEVVFQIANRPVHEHREAYEKYGQLTVSAVRKLIAEEQSGKLESKVTGPGRPRNFVLAVKDEDSLITYVSTDLTQKEWRRQGGAKAFWKALRDLVNRRELQDRLKEELG